MMKDIQLACCPYCGVTWQIDMEVDYLSDQDRLELTAQDVADVVCEDCIPLHLH